MFIYFKKTSANRFICDITDIVNIQTMTFDIETDVSEKPEIIIDNNPLDESNITNNSSGGISTITIKIPNTIPYIISLCIYNITNKIINYLSFLNIKFNINKI